MSEEQRGDQGIVTTLDRMATSRRSRRDVLKAGAGVAGAVYAVPVVETIFAGKVSAAASGGCPRGVGTDLYLSYSAANVYISGGYIVVDIGTANGPAAANAPIKWIGSSPTVTGVTVNTSGLTILAANPSSLASQIKLASVSLNQPYGAGSTQAGDGSSVTIFPDASNNLGLTFKFTIPNGLLSFRWHAQFLYDCLAQELDPDTGTSNNTTSSVRTSSSVRTPSDISSTTDGILVVIPNS